MRWLKKHQLMVGIVVVVLIILAVALSGKHQQNGEPQASASVSPSVSAAAGAKAPAKASLTPNPELASSPGKYTCAAGKTFTLTIKSDGTAYVTGGANTATAKQVLRKTPIGIWSSADGTVVVREIASYTVLVENNVVTRDSCVRK